MFGIFKKQPKPVNQRRPSTLEKVVGVRGYPEEIKGFPVMEFMAELAPPYGLNKFRIMKQNDPIVGGLLIQIENIMRNIKWKVEGPNAEYIQSTLQSLPGGVEWLNYDMASAFTYGFYIGEEVWRYENGRLNLKAVQPRFQPSIRNIDEDSYVKQQPANGGIVNIPYDKCLHHMYFSECRSPFGTSILRHLYKPYYYKISVEASESVGVDRDLSGVPMLTAPEGFDFTAADPDSPSYDPQTESTLSWALDLVSSVRKDSQAGIVKPNGWDFTILRGENRTSVPTSDIISRYNTEMAAGVLENFLSLGAFASTNNANTEVSVDNFLNACETYSGVMLKKYNELIEKICSLNDLEAPKMTFFQINQEDLSKIAGFFARMTSNGIITPTTTLEKELLDMAGYSYDDSPSARKPQNDKN